MTNRERFFAVLGRKPCDRVPLWLLFPYHRLGCYADVRKIPRYAEVWEKALKHTIMLDRRNFSVPIFTEEVVFRRQKFDNQGWTFEGTSLEFRGRCLFSGKKTRDGRTELCRYIENDADMEFFCSLPVNDCVANIEASLDLTLPQYLAEKAEFPLETGAMMLDLGEPIAVLYHSANLSEYPIWSLTHEDMIKDFLDRLMKRFRAIYRFCLERNLADVYFLVGSELASPPMVSRSTFQKWIVPYATELISMIRKAGCISIQHYHGQIKEILPDFLDMLPDALHTIEAPPTGNCTLKQAFDILGDKIALIGNMQYDCLRSLSSQEIADQVHSILEEASGRPFILSPTAGPFDAEPEKQIIENYLAFIDAAAQCSAVGSQVQ